MKVPRKSTIQWEQEQYQFADLPRLPPNAITAATAFSSSWNNVAHEGAAFAGGAAVAVAEEPGATAAAPTSSLSRTVVAEEEAAFMSVSGRSRVLMRGHLSRRQLRHGREQGKGRRLATAAGGGG